MKTLTRLINGQSDLSIDTAERGLNYGDGLFETIQIREGVPLLWAEHLARMRSGAKRLKIPFDDALQAAFLDDFAQLVTQVQGTAVLKLLLTRGLSQRGYKIIASAPVTRITTLSPAPDLANLQQGITVVLCQTQLARQPLLAGIKHLNRLEQVLARSEWDSPEITEGIVSDTQGYIVEACMSNLFWVKDNILYTPQLNLAGVEGVVRNKIIALCAQRQLIEIRSGFYAKRELLVADEIFVSNSVFDLLAVTKIAADYSDSSGKFVVLNFAQGPIFKKVRQLLQHFYLREMSD